MHAMCNSNIYKYICHTVKLSAVFACYLSCRYWCNYLYEVEKGYKLASTLLASILCLDINISFCLKVLLFLSTVWTSDKWKLKAWKFYQVMRCVSPHDDVHYHPLQTETSLSKVYKRTFLQAHLVCPHQSWHGKMHYNTNLSLIRITIWWLLQSFLLVSHIHIHNM